MVNTFHTDFLPHTSWTVEPGPQNGQGQGGSIAYQACIHRNDSPRKYCLLLQLANRKVHDFWCGFINLNKNILKQGMFIDFFFVKIGHMLSCCRCLERFIITFQQTKIIIIFIIGIRIGRIRGKRIYSLDRFETSSDRPESGHPCTGLIMFKPD